MFTLSSGSVDLNWVVCVAVSMDGAAFMTGRLSGVVKRILNKAPNANLNLYTLYMYWMTTQDVIIVVNTVEKSSRNLYVLGLNK